MKKINKTILMLFALVLSLSVTVGATVAYFSDYEQASGGATLQLGGKTELSEGDDSNFKDIVIENTGETDMIVRVGIYGPDEFYDSDNPKNLVTMKGDWMKGNDGMYYYGKVLKGKPDEQTPGENTGVGNLVAGLEFSWQGDPPDYYFEVTVVHEGSQAIYDGTKLKVPKGWDADAVASIQFDPVQPPASN